jgi:hypothetical protein
MWHRCGFFPRDFDRRGYLTFGWPVYHPELHAGAILAIKCEPGRRDAIKSAVLDAYGRLRRGASVIRAIGRWWRWKLKALQVPVGRPGVLRLVSRTGSTLTRYP